MKTRNEIQEALKVAWAARPNLEGPSGLEFEASDLDGLLRNWSYEDLQENLDRYGVYYSLCYLTPEFACYFVAGFMSYGLETWGNENTELNVAWFSASENLYYLLTGRRWPVNELSQMCSAAQANVIADFLEYSIPYISRVGISYESEDRILESILAWRERGQVR